MMVFNRLEDAAQAADEQNWSALTHQLYQISLQVQEQSLAVLPPEAEQVLIWALEVLQFGDFQDKWEISKVISNFRKSQFLPSERLYQPLLEVFQNEDLAEEIRWFAGRILGEFDTPDVIEALVEALQNSQEEEIVVVAASALANLGNSAITLLTELLKQPESRKVAVTALAQIHTPETIAPLLSTAQDADPTIRTIALEVLSSFHDPRITDLLIHALSDPVARVRKEAVIALGMRKDLLESLDVVGHLKPLLYDLNLEVCHQSAIALGRLGTESAVTALAEVLQSPHTPIPLQIEIVRSLPESEKTLEILQQTLTNSPEFPTVGLQMEMESPQPLWQEMIAVLGRIFEPHLQPFANQILLDIWQQHHPLTDIPSLKQLLALSLGQLGQASAVNALIPLLADADPGVKLHALAALKKIPNLPEILDQLAAQPNLSPSLRESLAYAQRELA